MRDLVSDLHKLETVITPLIQIQPSLYAKVETCQKTGSVKDRFVFEAVADAVRRKALNMTSTLVEATSGNTGISLAAAGAMLGLPVKIIMPCNMSEERRTMMRRFGAQIIDVGASDFDAAISLRNELCNENSTYWSPRQFENDYNCFVHETKTATEIHKAMKDVNSESWDFVSGAGTGGTLMGIARWMNKRQDTAGKIIQVAPLEDASAHGIQGINDGRDFLLETRYVHEQIKVSTNVAKNAAKDFARTHGILIGISAGANLVAAKRYLVKNPGRCVVTLLCDRGERYFSVC